MTTVLLLCHLNSEAPLTLTTLLGPTGLFLSTAARPYRTMKRPTSEDVMKFRFLLGDNDVETVGAEASKLFQIAVTAQVLPPRNHDEDTFCKGAQGKAS